MTTGHELDGVIKFLSRDEWRDCFKEIFDDHFGPVLDAGGLEFEDIAEMLGDDWANILWGCAFEDFMTQDFEVEGGNIADEYLKRRGWKEGAQAKAYIKALRNSVMSLYEVSEIVPGSSLLARDLIRGGEPIMVSERSATKSLKPWDKIAARIVPDMNKNVLAGGVLPFTPQAADDLFRGLRLVFGKKKTKKPPIIEDDELQTAASIFTHSWLFDTLDRMRAMPSLQNSDGHDIMFHDVRFPLASGVTQKDIATGISTIPGMSQEGISQENAKFWNWLEEKPKSKNKQKAELSLDTTMDNGYRVLGNVEIKGRFVHLMTNSAARAATGTDLLQKALGEFILTPLTEIRTVAQVMADRPELDPVNAITEIPDEIAEQAIHQLLDRQYSETLEKPVLMLGNKTPRQAAKTAAGRKKLAEWLKYLENQTTIGSETADPMATYSFEWMWRELGILELRQ